ncbi:MAG: hypothetical protein KGP29_02025 [Proteobacteria bacterium]|nr:hypothetical protein [Pseudomonadota bacterium]
MRRSIKTNLIAKLSGLIFLALVATYLASFLNTKKEISDVLDADLIKSAKLIFGVVQHDSFVEHSANLDVELQQKILNQFEYKIHSQAWKGGKIIYNSGESLILTEPDYEGFNDIFVGGTKWRSFSFFDEKSQIRILVLEKNSIRNHLIREIIFSLLVPLFIFFVPLFFIIFSTVRSELKPLELLALRIEEISGKTLKHFKNPQVPKELQPFLKSFNSLLTRLAESMDSERRFSNYAAHELNTPLAAIKLQAQLLASSKHPEKNAEYLEDLLAGVDRSVHLVDQLLTLSRLEVDDKNFPKEKFDLAKVAQALVLGRCEQNQKIKFRCANQNNEIKANKFYVEILIKNLLDNAIKYGFENTEIEVEVSEKILRITNVGKEISRQEIARIFDNFYRAKNSQDQSGCGLGLSIAKKIVNLHSGEIFFESQGGKNLVKVVFG